MTIHSQHSIHNPHFEQLHTIPNAQHIINLSNYSSPSIPMPEPYPAMPQAPIYDSFDPPPSTPLPEMIQVNSLKAESAVIKCPHCQQFVWTVVDHQVGLLTGLSIIGLFVVGCHNGGCLLPCMFPWTKDVVHSCPACEAKVATYKRLGGEIEVHP